MFKYTVALISLMATIQSYALCPLKSFTLQNLREVTRRLELAVKELNQCHIRGDLEAASQDISSSVSNIILSLIASKGQDSKLFREVYGFDKEGENGVVSIQSEYAKLFNRNVSFDGQDIDMDQLGGNIRDAMAGINTIATVLRDQNFKRDCGYTASSVNFGIAGLELFNQLAPIGVAIATGGVGGVATNYILGSFAAGNIASSVLKMIDERHAIYDMTSADKRNAFIASSCVYFELAMNAHVIDHTIDLPKNYLNAEKEKLTSVKDAIIEANKKYPPFQLITYYVTDMFRQLSEIKRSTESFGSLFDEDFDVAADDGEYVEGGDVTDEPLGDETSGEDIFEKYDTYNDVNGGLVTDIGNEILCEAVETYFNEPILDQTKQVFLVNSFMFVSQYAQEEGKTIENPFVLKAYGNNLVVTMYEEFVKKEFECDFDRIYNAVRTVSNFSRKQLKLLGQNYDKSYTPVMQDKAALEKQFKYFKALGDINYKINLIDKKISFMQKLNTDNYQIDLKEILGTERRIANELFKGKTLAYNWLRYNHKDTKYYLGTFSQKYNQLGSALDVKKGERSPRVCKKLGSAVRDYRYSRINVESNKLYCESMWPFITEVDFPEVYNYCAVYMEEREIKPYNYAGTWYNKFLLTAYPITGVRLLSYQYGKDLSPDSVFQAMKNTEAKYEKANKAYYTAGCERDYIEKDLKFETRDLDELDDIILDEITWDYYY
ncbi:MAG: hypothetical protein H6621_08190 [Halobacteriovoraceae bacterium]|nr:hypothetical protein [Halobacteriovoraceae bacterium]